MRESAIHYSRSVGHTELSNSLNSEVPSGGATERTNCNSRLPFGRFHRRAHRAFGRLVRRVGPMQLLRLPHAEQDSDPATCESPDCRMVLHSAVAQQRYGALVQVDAGNRAGSPGGDSLGGLESSRQRGFFFIMPCSTAVLYLPPTAPSSFQPSRRQYASVSCNAVKQRSC